MVVKIWTLAQFPTMQTCGFVYRQRHWLSRLPCAAADVLFQISTIAYKEQQLSGKMRGFNLIYNGGLTI